MSNPFGFIKCDLVGDIEKFPMGVVVKMMEIAKQQRGETQTDSELLKIMQRCAVGLFEWSRTDEKNRFWNDVIFRKKFDVFFEKYPEYRKYNYMI